MSTKNSTAIYTSQFGVPGSATPLGTVSVPAVNIGGDSHFLIIGGSVHKDGGMTGPIWEPINVAALADFWGRNPTTWPARTANYLHTIQGGAQVAIEETRLLKAGDTINTAELVPLCAGEWIDYVHLEVLAYN